MFGRKKKEWKVDLNVEGYLQAMTVSRNEGLDSVNPDFDNYPVNVELPRKMTFKQAMKKVIEYGKSGIYSIPYKGKRKQEEQVN